MRLLAVMAIQFLLSTQSKKILLTNCANKENLFMTLLL